MKPIANVYAEAVRKHFKVFYANWEPGVPISLGDYGYLKEDIFVPMGNLVDDFVEFQNNFLKIITDPTKDHKEFKSESGIDVNFLPEGTVNIQGTTLAKALLEIQFSTENAVYFNALGCTTSRISNKVKLGETLETLINKRQWEKRFCVVTDLVVADKAIIAISNSNSSGISFDVSSPLMQQIDIADANVKLNLKTEKNIGYKIPANEGLMLLIGLCKFKSSFMFKFPKFEPKLGLMQKFSIDFEALEKEEILSFVQLGEDEL
jgi:hypothetical protein